MLKSKRAFLHPYLHFLSTNAKEQYVHWKTSQELPLLYKQEVMACVGYSVICSRSQSVGWNMVQQKHKNSQTPLFLVLFVCLFFQTCKTVTLFVSLRSLSQCGSKIPEFRTRAHGIHMWIIKYSSMWVFILHLKYIWSLFCVSSLILWVASVVEKCHTKKQKNVNWCESTNIFSC